MLSGFSWKGSRYSCYKTLVFAFFLAIAGGCSFMTEDPSTPRVAVTTAGSGSAVPIPYQFQMVGFDDTRSYEEYDYKQLPFKQEDFLRQLYDNLRYNRFGSSTGTLRLKLTHYDMTQFKRDFSMSMGLHMLAKSSLGKILVDEEFSCSVDHYGSIVDYVDMAKELPDNPYLFTKGGWQVKVSDTLMRECVERIAIDFARAVIRGTPAQGG